MTDNKGYAGKASDPAYFKVAQYNARNGISEDSKANEIEQILQGKWKNAKGKLVRKWEERLSLVESKLSDIDNSDELRQVSDYLEMCALESRYLKRKIKQGDYRFEKIYDMAKGVQNSYNWTADFVDERGRASEERKKDKIERERIESERNRSELERKAEMDRAFDRDPVEVNRDIVNVFSGKTLGGEPVIARIGSNGVYKPQSWYQRMVEPHKKGWKEFGKSVAALIIGGVFAFGIIKGVEARDQYFEDLRYGQASVEKAQDNSLELAALGMR
tara:strand:- start:1452 stop:2273 length:822 start_codon:yes stop_codon:yes gene_type:complete